MTLTEIKTIIGIQPKGTVKFKGYVEGYVELYLLLHWHSTCSSVCGWERQPQGW